MLKNFRLVTAICFLLSLLLGLCPGMYVSGGNLEDLVDEVDLVAEPDTRKAVDSLYHLGILIDEIEDNWHYRPGDPLRRSDLIAILIRSMGPDYEAIAEEEKGDTVFADVSSDHWASGYVNLAWQLELTLGYEYIGVRLFRPERAVSYCELFTFMVRLTGHATRVTDQPWPWGYLQVAEELELTTGIELTDESTYFPATRGDVAKVTQRAVYHTIHPEHNQSIAEARFAW